MKFLSIILLMIFSISSVSQELVLPGDHPDPSVVKIGDTYWASSTSSNWFPAYPLLKSTDLKKWTLTSHVFQQLPEWADYYFWAPEISFENGRVYIYYAAHKKNGNLCVAVASADKPEGPYRDHGPLLCQEAGSIDAFPVRDIDGKLYMVWKEDGNSVGKPTPIWAIQMNEERTGMIGEKKELFRNDAQWEGNLVEGVSMVRHGEFLYAFYAGAGCCGRGCTYAIGIARTKSLLGPWEKYNKNPVLGNDEKWICPGHGTPVEKDGKNYFLYHAYNKKTNVYTGREGLLIEYNVTKDNWIEFIKQKNSSNPSESLITNDKFRNRILSPHWERNVFQKADVTVGGGKLKLSALPLPSGAFIGQKIVSGDFTSSITILTRKSSATSGLAVIGDEKNIISVVYSNNKLIIYQVKDGKETQIMERSIKAKNKLHLYVEVRNSKDISFWVINGNKKELGPLNAKPIDGSFLPPWDRALRTGPVSKGNPGEIAVFERFHVVYLYQ